MSNQKSNLTAGQITDKSAVVLDAEINAVNIFSRKSAFDLAARMSEAFSKSTIVPKDYQGNPSNCLIALEMANRIGTGVMMVMQNLYIVNGRPAWSSQLIIAMINNSKKYKTELQYDIKGSGEELECTAYAIDHNNQRIEGPTITMAMAKAEGWLSRNGSKWQTMPQVMIRYRAASFFGRLHCPDLIMGIYSADEVIDLPENQYQFVDPDTRPATVIEPNALEPSLESDIVDPLALTHNETVESTEGSDGIDESVEKESTENALLTEQPDMEVLICTDCGEAMTQVERRLSAKKYGRELCRKCQTAAAKG